MKEDIKNEIREVGKKMDKISLKEVIKERERERELKGSGRRKGRK